MKKKKCVRQDNILIEDKVEDIIEQPTEEPITEVVEDIVEDTVDEEPVEAVVDNEEEVEERVDEVIDEEPTEDVIEQPTEDVENEEVERIIEGYAIVFNELSEDLGGFREVIEPQAVNQELIDKSDIFYLYNHDDKTVPLARSKYGEGSLELTIDNKGLKYRFNCLNSEFYELVKRGDLDKSSFAFSLPKDGSGEKWEKSAEYNYIRRITKIEQLFDCSAVLVPAYSATELYARNKSTQIQPSDEYYNQYQMIINELEK